LYTIGMLVPHFLVIERDEKTCTTNLVTPSIIFHVVAQFLQEI
jgi:hypothetical protein